MPPQTHITLLITAAMQLLQSQLCFELEQRTHDCHDIKVE
jgi:hypothetical protein